MQPINPYDVVLDEEELQIEADFAAGLYKPVENFEELKSKLMEAAKNSMRKEQVSFRVNQRDLRTLKQNAALEGIPYQTFLGSILHKLARGQSVQYV